MATMGLEKPIRVGVFHDAGQAERAVQQLTERGFTEDQITVICSDRATEKRFEHYEHQEPAGYYTPAAVGGGAILGATLGALVTVVFVTASGVDVRFLLGMAMLAALTGAVVGGFFAAMMTRGVERELANFYDQELERGDILVAAEDHSAQAERALEEAEHILADAGARPMKLSEG